jgi:cellulose synthase/poly-beta-1,6-N-acetylglucosamine synthase-like glycosyltransferase
MLQKNPGCIPHVVDPASHAPDGVEQPPLYTVGQIAVSTRSRGKCGAFPSASPANARSGMGIATQNALIITPTLNERENVASLVETVFGLYPDIHFLFVDDQSPDGTAEEVKRLQSRYPNLLLIERRSAPSFGRSYLDGFAFALRQPWCRAIVTMDADFSHDPRIIHHLLARLGDVGAVIGSRYVAGGASRTGTCGGSP